MGEFKLFDINEFKSKTVIVTGSSRGIGSNLALNFGKLGSNVIINYISDESKANCELLKQEIIDSGGEAIIVKADVRKANEVKGMIDEAIENFTNIHVLINNAALYKDSVTWKMNDETWQEVLDTILTGTFNCSRAVLPYMRQNKYGRIINISSVVGQVGIFGTANYSAAKSGLFGFTKATAKETAIKNITVNALTLGYFKTGMNFRLSKEVNDLTLQGIPMGRFGELYELFNTVMFLSSSVASYITGQVIHLNGGYYM